MSRSPAARSTSAQDAADGDRSATGRRVVGLEADVSRAATSTRLVDEADASLGPIDILVNNAGVNIRGASESLTRGRLGHGHRHQPEGAVPLRARVRPAHGGARLGPHHQPGVDPQRDRLAGRAPYAASKAGVANLTRVLALEWAAQGVTVNAICPGPFGTEMNRPLMNDPEKYAAFVAKIPDGPMGRAARDHGRRRLPRLRRLVVRDRQPALRRRRLDGAIASRPGSADELSNDEEDGADCDCHRHPRSLNATRRHGCMALAEGQPEAVEARPPTGRYRCPRPLRRPLRNAPSAISLPHSMMLR